MFFRITEDSRNVQRFHQTPPEPGSDNPQEFPEFFPMSIDMRTLCHLVGDMLRRGPPELIERLSPWIIGILGAAMLGIMMYAWWP